MITPSDSPSSPSGYAGVAVQPMDIQAPQADLADEFAAANALAGAGTLYPQGPRQAETAVLLQSPQGFAVGGYDIDAGWHGGGGDDGWPNNVEPGGM